MDIFYFSSVYLYRIEHNSSKYMKFSTYHFHTVTYHLNTKSTTNIIGVTYDETQAVMITKQQYLICLHTNEQFCKIDASFQALTNPPSCVAALYARNNQEIEVQCSLSIFHIPPAFTHLIITSNLWILISTPATQGSAVTMVY